MQKITPNSFIFFHSFIFVFFFLGLQLANAQVDLATWSLSNDGIPVNVQPEVNAAEFGFSSGLTNQRFTHGLGAEATSWSDNDGLTEYYQIAISPQPGDFTAPILNHFLV